MYRIEPMTQDDVPEVSRVERRCFTNPWPIAAYRRELRAPEHNVYLVLRDYPSPSGGPAEAESNGNGTARAVDAGRQLPRLPLLAFGRRAETDGTPPIIGFAGMWIMYDEAHVTTIGVEPEQRGRGLGELLLVALFDEALRRGAGWLTLEVRVSNEAAQALYRKYEFTVQGTRRRYYSDNNEDAYIMWSPSLRDHAYLERYAALRRQIGERLGLEFAHAS